MLSEDGGAGIHAACSCMSMTCRRLSVALVYVGVCLSDRISGFAHPDGGRLNLQRPYRNSVCHGLRNPLFLSIKIESGMSARGIRWLTASRPESVT